MAGTTQPGQHAGARSAFAIHENPVPLSSSTTYSFKEKLGFVVNARVWLPASSGAPDGDRFQS